MSRLLSRNADSFPHGAERRVAGTVPYRLAFLRVLLHIASKRRRHPRAQVSSLALCSQSFARLNPERAPHRHHAGEQNRRHHEQHACRQKRAHLSDFRESAQYQ